MPNSNQFEKIEDGSKNGGVMLEKAVVVPILLG